MPSERNFQHLHGARANEGREPKYDDALHLRFCLAIINGNPSIGALAVEAARRAGEVEVGDAAGERARQAMTRIFSFPPPEASGESETEFPALQNARSQ